MAAALGACAAVIDSRAEEIIRIELPRWVGPARDYQVDATGVVPASGELRTVRVVGSRIARPGSPVIDHAEIDLRELRVDRAEKRVVSIGGARARARVLSSDIASHLDTRPGLDDVQVQFHGTDEISLSAVPAVAGFVLPGGARVSLRGRLVPDGPRLLLQVADLRAAGISVGTLPRAALEQVINPIIDLSQLPAPAQMGSARVEGDALIVEATGVTSVSADAATSRP